MIVSSFSFAESAQTLLKLKADYVVPFQEGFETPESSRRFSIDYKVIQNRDGGDRTLFTLPRELVGKKMLIDMTVVSQTVDENGIVQKALTGPMGDAICSGPWAKMQCVYKFTGTEINPLEVKNFLKAKYGEGSKRYLELLEVSRVFKCDPLGEVQTLKKALSVSPVSSCATF